METDTLCPVNANTGSKSAVKCQKKDQALSYSLASKLHLADFFSSKPNYSADSNLLLKVLLAHAFLDLSVIVTMSVITDLFDHFDLFNVN